MKNRFIVYYARDGLAAPETYWTGDITDAGYPQVSNDFAEAAHFESAAAAYKAATRHAKRGIIHLWRFRVGQRPQPVNLRAAA